MMVFHRIFYTAWTETRLCLLKSPSLNLDIDIDEALISSKAVMSIWLSCGALKVNLGRLLCLSFRSNLRY